MKRIVRKICLGILCLVLLLPGTCAADQRLSVKLGIQKDRVTFRLKNLSEEDGKDTLPVYKVLLFTGAEFQDETAWICIYDGEYDAGSDIIENVPFVENIAVKVFERSNSGWTDCIELHKSNTGFSKVTCRAVIREPSSQGEAPEETEEEAVYVLMDQDRTILPLELAEELYGFEADMRENRMSVTKGDRVFSKTPVFFACRKKDANGITLEQYFPETLQETEKEEAEFIETESETVALTEEETEETVTEKEEIEEEESEKAVTEKEEIEEETEEALTETGAARQAVTENAAERVSEEAGKTEKEAAPPTKAGVWLVGVLLIWILLLVFALLRMNRRLKEKEKIKITPQNKNEDTIDPESTILPSEVRTAIQGAVANHKGRVRRNNEDNFYFNGAYMHRAEMDEGAFISGDSQDTVQLYAVCDGMGGADSGEEASHRAVKELFAGKQEHPKMMNPKELTAVLRRISEKINQEAVQRGQKSGTTIAMILVSGQRAIAANVGDSRIYCFRDRKLTQVSVDHSKVQRMISMGILTPEQAKTDPGRHVITQYLGMPPEIKVSPYMVSDMELRKDDVYLLCSDGLTDMVDDSQIEAILKEKKKPKEAVQELLKTALNNGGRDNVTVLLLRI
ncbi:MAG: protein phosphatase 2C domain-containing protein [Lachnospiraceae bacterium]|nr:protein phosphatase 2C domain-containing protein [Lachnospiraceae bacterium]